MTDVADGSIAHRLIRDKMGTHGCICNCQYLVFDDNIQKIQKFLVRTYRILEAV
jgi:hypothetical protein